MPRTVAADNVGVTFVNMLVGRGTLNDVINLTFATFDFTPDTEVEGGVDLDPKISCRLRMDKYCARVLRDTLSELLDDIDTKATKSPPSVPSTGVVSGKPN